MMELSAGKLSQKVGRTYFLSSPFYHLMLHTSIHTVLLKRMSVKPYTQLYNKETLVNIGFIASIKKSRIRHLSPANTG